MPESTPPLDPDELIRGLQELLRTTRGMLRAVLTVLDEEIN